MAIDLKTEKIQLLTKKAKDGFPQSPVSLSSVNRWVYRGAGPNRVKLEIVTLSGLRYTSDEAIQRFVEAQNVSPVSAPSVSPVQRRRQAEAAMKELVGTR